MKTALFDGLHGRSIREFGGLPDYSTARYEGVEGAVPA